MTEFVTTSDGIRLSVFLHGPQDASPLLLSNSLGTDHSMWAPQTRRLSERFRVLTYDSRGHGSSDAPAGDYSIERLALDALDIADWLGWQQFNMAGASLGGMLGLWIAQNRPERLRRVIVANAAPYTGGPASWIDRMAMIRKDGLAAIVEDVAGRWFTPEFAASHPGLVAHMKDRLLAGPAQGYLGCSAALAAMDLRPKLRNIKTPLLWIAGSQDKLPPIEQLRADAAQVPSGRFLALHAAHLSNLEAQDSFVQAIEDFFL